MTLHDEMYDAVADVTADLSRLTRESRSAGARIRRRRRLAVGAGVAASLALLGGVGYLAVPGPSGDSQAPPVAAAPSGSTELSGVTAPISGRGAAAALGSLLGEVSEAEIIGYGGSDPADLDSGTPVDDGSYAEVRIRVGGGTSLVQLNLQDLSFVGEGPYTCTKRPYFVPGSCEVTLLESGDTLRTYRTDEGRDGGNRPVAEVLSPERGMRVVVGATEPAGGGDAVTVGQLSHVVTQPWWNLEELPVEYAEAGRSLAPYADRSANDSEPSDSER